MGRTEKSYEGEVSTGSGVGAGPDWLQSFPLLLPAWVPQFLPSGKGFQMSTFQRDVRIKGDRPGENRGSVWSC